MSHFDHPQDRTPLLDEALSLQSTLDAPRFSLLQTVSDFASHKVNIDDGDESRENVLTDPTIIADDVATQISFLRKLKFQYIEQNAKDKYIKSIVSDIDDASIVTADDNKNIETANVQRKEALRLSKQRLEQKHQDIRTLAPLVEQDYNKAKRLTAEANALSQKILDARLALRRLRQAHPHPRLTIPAADQELENQITEMQNLNDEIESVSKQVHSAKDSMKSQGTQVESLRMERTETEKAIKIASVDENDGRIVPLYDWYMASLALHQSIYQLHSTYSATENELHLTYHIQTQREDKIVPAEVSIVLIFAPNTRQLAEVQCIGIDELGVDIGDVVDAHVQVNDVHGVVAAIMARLGRLGTV